MKLRHRQFDLKVQDIILFLCLVLVCLTGHEGTGTITSLGRYLLFALLIVEVFRKKMVLTKPLSFFLVITLLAGVINSAYNVFGNKLHYNIFASLRSIFYYGMYVYCGFYIAYKYKKTDTIFTWIHRISVCAVAIVITQYALYLVGIHLNQIAFFGQYLFHAVDTSWYFRPSAFFSEPSYLAEIVLLDLYNSLYRKRNKWYAVADLLALALSTSSLGIVFGYGLLLWWAVSQTIVKNKILNFLIKVGLIVSFVAGLVKFLAYTGDNRIINRILNGATISQRTLRAFEIYGRLSPLEKIFGIGMQNLSNYLNYNSISLVNEGIDTLMNKEFAQSFGYILCTLGGLGIIGFCSLILYFLCKIPFKENSIVVLFLAMSLTASLVTRQYFSILLV